MFWGRLGLPKRTRAQHGVGDPRSGVGSSQGWRCRRTWEGSKLEFPGEAAGGKAQKWGQESYREETCTQGVWDEGECEGVRSCVPQAPRTHISIRANSISKDRTPHKKMPMFKSLPVFPPGPRDPSQFGPTVSLMLL